MNISITDIHLAIELLEKPNDYRVIFICDPDTTIEGKIEGKMEGAREIAVKLLLRKNMHLDEIAEITGLEEKEVARLKKEHNV